MSVASISETNSALISSLLRCSHDCVPRLCVPSTDRVPDRWRSAPCAGTFTNATAVAPFAATWAAAPDAVMYFIHDGSAAKALVQLSQPAYDAKTGQLAFAARMLPADAQQLSFARGATARVRSLAWLVLGGQSPHYVAICGCLLHQICCKQITVWHVRSLPVAHEPDYCASGERSK